MARLSLGLCRGEEGRGGKGVRVVGGVALLLLAIIPNTEATILALRTTNKKTSQEIKEVVKGFQSPPLASKQPSIP